MELSIVIPVFNAERWIADTLRSVAPQLTDSFEVIVVNDGSTDGSREIITSQFPWVRLLDQPNSGCSSARSNGTKIASGRFIKYLDSDDLILSGVLARQLALAERTGADAVYGNWQRLVQNNLGDWIAGEIVHRKIEDFDSDPEIAFFNNMWCPTAAYLWNAKFLQEKHPGWHPKLPVIQDARFAFDAARFGCCFAYDDEITMLYRTHQNESVSTRSRESFMEDVLTHTLESEKQWRSDGRLSNKRREAICDSLVSLARRGNELQSSRALAVLAEIDGSFTPGKRTLLGMVSAAIGTQKAIRLARFVDQVSSKLKKKA